MSPLQISLAVVGAVLLLVVLLHGAWTSRKNLPKQASHEANAGVGQGDEVPGLTDPLERQEPAFDGSLEALATLTLPEKKVGLDALIDVIAPITVDTQVSGEAALAAMPATRRAGSKPLPTR
jgi:hypothetical protein